VKEKTADEVFEELGYEKIIESNVRIDYEKEGQFFDKEIVFGLIDKIVCVELGTGESANINVQELQAINKKVEELGWNEKS
jgi:hypothetical protein